MTDAGERRPETILPAKGVLRAAALDCRIAPYAWSFATRETQRIEAHWADLVAAKPQLYDGRVLLAHRLSYEPGNGGTIRGDHFETGYKDFLGWRDFGHPGETVRNCFAMPALRSADGAFMLGRMSATTANGGKLYFPAGTPEPSDADACGRIDFTANILRELAEETGIGAAEITLGDAWTIVAAGARVAFMRIAQSTETADTLRRRLQVFNETAPHAELDDLVPMRGSQDYDTANMPDFMVTYLDHVLCSIR